MNVRPLVPTPVALLTLVMATSLYFVFGGSAGSGLSGPEAAVVGGSSQYGTGKESIADELNAATVMLASAQQALAGNDYERAGRLADEALVDAQVAERHAQSAHSRKAAQQIQNAVQSLQSKIGQRAILVAQK